MPKKKSDFEGIGQDHMTTSEGAKDEATPEMKEVAQAANKDVEDMIRYRRPAVQIAEEAILGYMALAQPSKTGRSSFFPPTLHSIVYSKMALEAATIPNVVYKHRRAKSEPLMKYINAAKKHAEAGDYNMRPPALFNWYLQNFDKILFGVGFRYLSYSCQTRKIHVKDDNGDWVKKTCVVYDDIWDQKLSFFHTGVSRDTLPGMFGGTSAYTDFFYRREQFSAKFLDNPLYLNIQHALDTIKSEFIRVRMYWNLPLDIMLMQAMDGSPETADENAGGCVIRLDHILEYGSPDRPQKFIPITSIHGDFSFDYKTSSQLDIGYLNQGGRMHSEPIALSNNQTFWTSGDGYLTKGVIAAKRALWRATNDNIKSSTIFFAMSQNPGVLSQLKRSDMYGVIPLKADDRSFNVKALLERPQAFNGIKEYDDALDNLAVYALGHDWRQSAYQNTNEKATTASIRENMKHVRSQQGQQMNETGGIARHYWCYLQLIQQFYPEKTRIDLADDEDLPEDVEEYDIIRDHDGSVTGEKNKPIAYKRVKKIPYEEMISVKYDKKGNVKSVKQDDEEGEMYFPGSKKLLVTEEEPEIYIEPGSTFASMKALERALNLEKLDTYLRFAQLTYTDEEGAVKPVLGRKAIEALLRNSAEVWEDDPDEIIPQEKEVEEKPRIHKPYQSMRKPTMNSSMPTQGMPVTAPPSAAPQGSSVPNPLAESLRPGRMSI